MRDIRLGDDIDDFCVRCKRVMNHNVVSVLDGKPAKVRCRTCHSDHDFRNEQPPPPKVDARKAALFNEVLKKVAPGDGTAPAEDDLELVVDPEAEVDIEGEVEGETEAEVDADAEAVEAEPVEVADDAAKPKRGRGRPKK
jgi:hypothetical protein